LKEHHSKEQPKLLKNSSKSHLKEQPTNFERTLFDQSTYPVSRVPGVKVKVV
jgi:hypothetical protein